MRTTFLEALHSRHVLLMDGAMGTELLRAGIQPDKCYELLNVTDPKLVEAIHRAYVEAGAEVLLTNTFQALYSNIVNRGLASQWEDIWRAGVKLPRIAGTFVLASLGPGEWQSVNADEIYFDPVQQADALLLETLNALHDAAPSCLRAQRRWCGSKALPVLVSATYYHSPNAGLATFLEHPPEVIAYEANNIPGIVALGVNCGRDISIDDCIEIIRRYRTVTDLPLFARPNAGTPTQVDGQWIYPHSSEEMAARLPELLAAGVAMVGGCCGTTPAHIAAFKPIVDQWNATKKK
jgi:5-methyltetrahydrofolate--homocysteine methyltransferase